MRSRVLRTLAAGVVAIVVGCGSNTAASSTHGIQLSRAKSYTSVRQLAADSTLVVIGSATANVRIETINNIPFTVTSITVSRVLKGSWTGTSLAVRQTGSTSDPVGGSPLVSPGETYLLFLQPFVGVPGTSGQFVVVGVAAGLFRVNGQFAYRLDPESPSLPATIAVADIPGLVK